MKTNSLYPDPTGPGPESTQILTLDVSDLLKFVLEQPGEQELNQGWNVVDAPCPQCVLVQYGLHIGLSFYEYKDVYVPHGAYVDRLYQPVAVFNHYPFMFWDSGLPIARNYSELRALLKPQYQP